MQKTLIGLFRLLPPWLLYGVMALVIPFYVLFDGKARRSSWRFFRKRIGYGRLRSALHVYINMFNMGMVVLDRFAAYAGRKFRIDLADAGLYQDYCREKDGFVILSSHVGNYEMAGYSLLSPKRMNVLVYAGETATVMANRERMFSGGNVSMVPVSEDMSHLFRLNNALAGGEIASLPADRVFGSSKAVRCSFLGADASFPTGPFTLAVSREVKALAAFCVKTGLRSYKVMMHPVAGDSVKTLAQAFAAEVETVVRKWPDQWYNFYDFWA
ncbi:MAG: hypothetical protein IJU21_05030 [Bacteroidales bacterium]|nr:hypothetical protein [Bacteroidales bacterium]